MAGYKDPPKEHQFKPGQVANPNGSSAKQRMTTALIKAIEKKGLDDPFVQVGLREALKGNFQFWSYIYDRVDGKMPPAKEPDATEGNEQQSATDEHGTPIEP